MKADVDILIFGGQSNMQGQTESMPEPNDPVEKALEYRFLEDDLIPVCHPSGEQIEGDLLLPAHNGYGTLVPDCCRAYIQETGHKVVAIHAARGATKISEWLKGTPRYTCAQKKIQAGIEKAGTLGKIGKVYYLWLQGESDAVARTSKEDYMQMMTVYKNDLKNDIGIDKFGIIEVGYYCRGVCHLNGESKEDSCARDEAVMHAQEQLVKEDKDFTMLTQVCKRISLDPEYINPKVAGHYNNKAMTLIGTEAGRALARL